MRLAIAGVINENERRSQENRPDDPWVWGGVVAYRVARPKTPQRADVRVVEDLTLCLANVQLDHRGFMPRKPPRRNKNGVSAKGHRRGPGV